MAHQTNAAAALPQCHPIYYQHTGPELCRDFESIANLIAQGKTLDQIPELSGNAIRHAISECRELYDHSPDSTQQFFAVVPENEIVIVIDPERKTIVAHTHATLTGKGTLKLKQGFRAGAYAIDTVIDIKMVYVNAEHAVEKLNGLLGELGTYN